eukprot:m.207886 g.207886  ORF g.207886 m.207886 type:complete len:68 (+) comp15806_c0_seq12:162-365(+)
MRVNVFLVSLHVYSYDRRFLGNITDPKNPDLVKALLGGTLDPVDFTKMSPQVRKSTCFSFLSQLCLR